MTQYGFNHPCASRTQEDIDFDKWYQQKYGNPFQTKKLRSFKYYELRTAWKAAKKFYEGAK